jgi:acetyl-CoA carboxylase carboxyltransferase component
MAGQGFDPDFILSWPTGRMAVMEGESAIMAAHGTAIERAQKEHRELDAVTQQSIDSMRTDYEHQLDARYAAARGFVDAIVPPDESRNLLALLFQVAANNPGPHLGPFVLEGLS